MKTKLDFSAYITDCTRGFTGREWVFAETDRGLADPDMPRSFFFGEPGIGKAAVAASQSGAARNQKLSVLSCRIEQG